MSNKFWRRSRAFGPVWLVAIAATLSACSSIDPSKYQQLQTAYAQPYQLDSGDALRITVFGQRELTRIYPVDDGGNVSMPLIGTVRARGITT
ncbi:MAG: polysaccharide biosynthesis/export family protein [Alphaproteobacteria bacterium]